MTDDAITAPIAIAHPAIIDCLLHAARDTLGIHETSRNSGPDIDRWLYNVRQTPGQPWCAAWHYSMWLRASRVVGAPNPCPRTAGALRTWKLADAHFRVTADEVRERPSLLRPGMSFLEDHSGDPRDGEGKGHIGIVTAGLCGDLFRAISGNTNPAGSREGVSVVEQSRSLSRAFGFLDFTREA